MVLVNLSSSYPISPLLYGANFATSNLLQWGVGVNRNGGDAQSNWNWQLDATNSGTTHTPHTLTHTHTHMDGRQRDSSEWKDMD